MYTLLSGVDTTLRDLPPLRCHVSLSAFYCSVKALLKGRTEKALTSAVQILCQL